jgi:TRAP-type C4-dicarboxylate transport system permease small subunit
MSNDAAVIGSGTSWRRGVAKASESVSIVAGVALVVLMVHVSLSVILRKAFNIDLPGTIEIISNWWMPLILYCGLALTQRKNEHIQVTLITGALSPRLSRIAHTVACFIAAAMVSYLTFYAVQGAVESFEIREAAVGVVNFPIWPVKALIPLGLVMWTLQLLTDAFPARDRLTERGDS